MIDEIKNKTGNSKDLVIRELDICNEKVSLLFFETLCDTKNINDFILEYLSYLKINKKISLNIKDYIKKYIPTYKIIEVKTIDEILKYLFSGFAILNVGNTYYAMEFKRSLDSGIMKVENEKTIKGPKDAFTENYQTNIGLIRKRIRNENLFLKEVTVGKKSSTKVGILYMNDIANTNFVEKIVDRIENIDIDSIPDSNYIYEYISNNKSLFPSVLSTERPDLVSFKLLNGKVAIVVDNTPYVILLPAFYIALITYNHEILPPSLVINFAMQKEGVPFPTILEAIIMNITFEILRETDIRAPSALGSALSIVGALVLGDAAVKAGLVSPIMVIVIAITAISVLIFSVNDVSNAVKIWRIIFIIFASISGILGVFIALILLICELNSISSFGFPFMYPLSPLDIKDQGNDIVLTKNYKMQYRNKLTAKKNIRRGVL